MLPHESNPKCLKSVSLTKSSDDIKFKTQDHFFRSTNRDRAFNSMQKWEPKPISGH